MRLDDWLVAAAAAAILEAERLAARAQLGAVIWQGPRDLMWVVSVGLQVREQGAATGFRAIAWDRVTGWTWGGDPGEDADRPGALLRLDIAAVDGLAQAGQQPARGGLRSWRRS